MKEWYQDIPEDGIECYASNISQDTVDNLSRNPGDCPIVVIIATTTIRGQMRFLTEHSVFKYAKPVTSQIPVTD